ncbi:transposase [Caldimonas tepidiphila]|uniref:transposase n=1 Tax=Caldimonas tepidiphila TaxID=2315841 RepID=UPI000E5B5D58
MRKSRFADEQIAGFLKQAETGMSVKDICRQVGFNNATFHKWQARFSGMEVSETQRLRDLEAENARPKKLLAEEHLDIEGLEGGLWGKALPPRERRAARCPEGRAVEHLGAPRVPPRGAVEDVFSATALRMLERCGWASASSSWRTSAGASATGASTTCCALKA